MKFLIRISINCFLFQPFNLGMPSFAKNHDASCSLGIAGAVSLGIDASFLLALLACLAVLLILLVGVVVHRRKADEMLKDADDIRENIINYEDEGGGEGDMTGYDLTVLRLGYDDVQGNGKLPYSAISPGEVPDICGFLDGKKSSVDNDPETGTLFFHGVLMGIFPHSCATFLYEVGGK